MDKSQDLAYHLSVVRSLVGIVKVDISSLEFKRDELGLRALDSKIIRRLVKVFDQEQDVDPSQKLESTRCDWENHVEAAVNSRELDQLLLSSQLTRGDLQRSIWDGHYPRLRMGRRKLQCLHGQHRLLAAVKVLKPGDRWWPVQISCFEPGSKSRI